MSPEWRVNGADAGARSPAWVTLWQSRELIRFFALRDLRVRYQQAALGVLWVLLQPVVSVVILTLVFSRLARISSQGIPYPLFALLGMVVWSYFSTATLRASEVLVNNPQLVTKVYFPRIVSPAAAMLAPLVDLAVSMVLTLLLMLYYGRTPSWRMLAAPLWLALLVLTAFAIALWLSAWNVRYRDVQQVVGPVLQIWLFASPVAYPSTLLSGWQEIAYAVNPMAGVIGLARWSILDAPWPGWPLAVSALTTTAILVGGVRYFDRAQRLFADVI